MNRDELLAFVDTLDEEWLKETFSQADYFVKCCEDRLSNEFQVAASKITPN